MTSNNHPQAVRFAGSSRLEAHFAVVLYDPADGRIVRMHHMLVTEGAAAPDAEGRATLARNAAHEAGQDTSGLAVLEVDGATIRRDALYAVDVATRSLTYEEMPRRSP